MVRQLAAASALLLLAACDPGERETGNIVRNGGMDEVGAEGAQSGARGNAQTAAAPIDVVIENTGSEPRLARVNVSVLGPWTGNNSVTRVMESWEKVVTIDPHATLSFPAVVNGARGARIVTNAQVLREAGGLIDSGHGYDFAPFTSGTKCVATVSDAAAPNGARMRCTGAE
ncbi:hypothetical protein ACLEPN_35030 [Myxococcus sp. 1LA]